MSDKADVAILTPMPLEFKAVYAHLHDPRLIWHQDGTAAEVGTVPGVPWPVAVVLTGKGTAAASALAERVATWLEPRMLLVAGVAGALKDDIELGDVVVATSVYAYHSGKEDNSGFHPRPRAWQSQHRLTQAAGLAAAIDSGWSDTLDRQPSVHFEPIAAGDVVLNSATSPLREQLREHYDDAAAIEMESAGVMAAAHLRDQLPVLTIRGISDHADGNKHRSDQAGAQPVAAAHAAAFAMAVLRQLSASFAAGQDAAGQDAGAPGCAAPPPLSYACCPRPRRRRWNNGCWPVSPPNWSPRAGSRTCSPRTSPYRENPVSPRPPRPAWLSPAVTNAAAGCRCLRTSGARRSTSRI